MTDPNHNFEGELSAAGLRLAIIVSRYNSEITDRLREGALEGLKGSGGDIDLIDVIHIPGAFEFPLTVKTVAATGKYEAIICLGAVIRGDTPHFEYVASEAARGIAQASLDSGLPVSFGVLTTDTIEQATDRAGGKDGNKGFEAAMTAVEMVHLIRRLRSQI